MNKKQLLNYGFYQSASHPDFYCIQKGEFLIQVNLYEKYCLISRGAYFGKLTNQIQIPINRNFFKLIEILCEYE